MSEIGLRNYAHLGDAVWELFVRERTIKMTYKMGDLHKLTTTYVKAKHQCELLNNMTELLREDEHELVRRGRNMPVPVARRQNQSEYRMATAFEVLIGYWYLEDKKRLEEMLKKIEEIENFQKN